MNADNITAAEYHAAGTRAFGNLDAKKDFKLLNEKIEARPKVKERLAFEFLTLLERDLEEAHSAHQWIVHAAMFCRSISNERRPEFFDRVARVVEMTFETLSTAQDLQTRQLSVEGVFATGLILLSQTDSDRFEAFHRRLQNVADPSEFRAKLLRDVITSLRTGRFRLAHRKIESEEPKGATVLGPGWKN